MARRNRKVKTPAEIAAELLLKRKNTFGKVGLQPEQGELVAFADVIPTRAGEKREDADKKVDEDSIIRADAFKALQKGMEPNSYAAVRRLERDMVIRRGERDSGRFVERVDGDGGLKGREDAKIDAGLRVDAVLMRIGERDQWLLSELIAPRMETALVCKGDWRRVVWYITGETNEHAQGAVVRQACRNLALAYDALPRAAAISTAKGERLKAA